LSEAAEATPHRSREEDRAPEPKRILLVEDDADAGFTMRELLESVGHEVLFANDAPSGLDLARTRRPDLVLCDVGLPGMSGYEFARRMRADALLRGVALAALTGFGRPEDRARALEAGFDEHLTKPADIEAVQAVVRRLTLSG